MLPALYHDLQSTIQDAYVSAAYFQHLESNSELFIHLLGTDQLESLFSVFRTVTHSKNVDFLELIDKIHACSQVDSVYKNHPELKANNRTDFTTHDKSSIQSWKGKVSISCHN